MNIEELKYPIGKFILPTDISNADIEAYIIEFKELPNKLNNLVKNLNEQQLDTPYRLGGWTIRQVIHHLADANMNGFIRIKLALTEKNPIIKPYNENSWAELIDSKSFPIVSSLKILEGVHERWVTLLQSLKEDDLKKTYFHPEKANTVSLSEFLAHYAWHGKHHLKHIQNTIDNF